MAKEPDAVVIHESEQDIEKSVENQLEEVNFNLDENGDMVISGSSSKFVKIILFLRMNPNLENLVGVLKLITLIWSSLKKIIRSNWQKQQERNKIQIQKLKNEGGVVYRQIDLNVEEVNHQLKKMNLP